MKQRQFELHNQAQWDEFEAALSLLESSHGKPATDSPALAEFPHRYRRLCHQHALAVERGYSLTLVERLNDGMLRGRRQLYRFKIPVLAPLRNLLLAGFPRAVRNQWIWHLSSGLIFVGSVLLLWLLVTQQPAMVYSMLDESSVAEMETMYAPGSDLHKARTVSDDVTMFGYYIYNNIGIAFRTFASGLFAGIGALVVMVFNGAFFGAIAGHLVNTGSDQPFFTFVIAHGAPELTAIVLSGGAGLRLGWSLVSPGALSRPQALKVAASECMPVMYGAFALLLSAAFIEAFWSPRQLPAEVKYTVGAILWVLLYAYLLLAGRGGSNVEGGAP